MLYVCVCSMMVLNGLTLNSVCVCVLSVVVVMAHTHTHLCFLVIRVASQTSRTYTKRICVDDALFTLARSTPITIRNLTNFLSVFARPETTQTQFHNRKRNAAEIVRPNVRDSAIMKRSRIEELQYNARGGAAGQNAATNNSSSNNSGVGGVPAGVASIVAGGGGHRILTSQQQQQQHNVTNGMCTMSGE